ncbi:MAG: hypothetical protein M3310_01100, partial [Actinomycetota bacterium]|nr:hypothetical protein [Actinomycetota bacterium]
MPQGLPRSAGALLAATLALIAAALFFGDGSSYGALVWVGAAALVLAGFGVAAAAWSLLPLGRPDRAGVAFLVLFAAFVAWMATSVAWSVAPDRSWEYANRGLVYLAFLALGLLAGSAARSARPFAYGLAGVVMAVVAWALVGKIVPDLFPDGERIARLRDPLGYWNALALVAAVALVLALWIASWPEHRRALR